MNPLPSSEVSSIRVLLVDDDACVRDAVSMYLRDRGYEVHEEADGHGAFESYRENSFLFVITDFQFIPGQRISSCGRNIRHGADLVREIRTIAPAQRMAIMSGDPQLVRANLDISVSDISILDKPFGMEKLLALIKEAEVLASYATQNPT